MFKKLAKDSLAFFSNSFFSKFAGILLVTVYTRYLSTYEYGTGELVYNTATVLMPLITMGITDGIMRFSLDNKNHTELLSCGYLVITIGMLVVGVGSFALSNLNIISVNSLPTVLILSFLLSIDSIYGAYTKGCDRTKTFAFVGIVRTIILVLSVFVTIVMLKLRLKGYLASLIISYAASIVLYIIDSKGKVLFFSRPTKQLLRQLLLYSLPLISNAICWKVVNLSDKFFIASYIDNSAVGIYSVSQKIPIIVSTFTAVFIQAWQITATRQHQCNNLTDAFNSVQRIYCWFIGFISIICSVFCKPIIGVFAGSEFQNAYVFIPILVLGAFFNSMTAFYGSAYMVTKHTSSIFYSSLIAAIANIILNAILIPSMHETGAALATLISYILAWIVRILRMKNCEELVVYHAYPIKYAIGLTFVVALAHFEQYAFAGVLGMIIFAVSCVSVRNDLKDILHDLLPKKNGDA